MRKKFYPFARANSAKTAHMCVPGRIKVGRWNERVRAKRCDAVYCDYALKCRLFSTSVWACDVVCILDSAAVTESWRLELFSCTSSSFLCAGTLSPRGKCCYFFCERFSWSRQTSLSNGFSCYFPYPPWYALIREVSHHVYVETANANSYHVTKFSLNLSFTVHYFYTN